MISFPAISTKELRTLVVTGADEGYFSLLDGLLDSLHQWDEQPFADLACFDLGLEARSRASVATRVSRIVEPSWDLPVDAELCRTRPGLRGHTVRPFLPRYFPGYDIYIWIDADAWVQRRFALEWLAGAAAQGLLGAVAHVHPAYETSDEVIQRRRGRMKAYYGQETADQIRWDMYLNSGVIALAANAPHWAAWEASFTRGLEACQGKLVTDQAALNHAVWIERLPVCPLPALCNWVTHLAMPGLDLVRGGFCEPVPPAHQIGILHLTDKSWIPIPYDLGDGSYRSVSLRFSGRNGSGS